MRQFKESYMQGMRKYTQSFTITLQRKDEDPAHMLDRIHTLAEMARKAKTGECHISNSWLDLVYPNAKIIGQAFEKKADLEGTVEATLGLMLNGGRQSGTHGRKIRQLMQFLLMRAIIPVVLDQQEKQISDSGFAKKITGLKIQQTHAKTADELRKEYHDSLKEKVRVARQAYNKGDNSLLG